MVTGKTGLIPRENENLCVSHQGRDQQRRGGMSVSLPHSPPRARRQTAQLASWLNQIS